jgi:hypothetical protein
MRRAEHVNDERLSKNDINLQDFGQRDHLALVGHF